MTQPSCARPRSKKQVLNFKLTSLAHLGSNNYLLRCIPPLSTEMPLMLPGQFVEIKVPHQGVLLRRPISVCNVEGGELWLLVAKVGLGTQSLSEMRPGDELDIMLPLGNSFSTGSVRSPLLVGGGVGIAPMLYLAKHFTQEGIRPDILLGGRSHAHLALLDEFARYGRVHITTDDGSMGLKGLVVDHEILSQSTHERIYTCGPKPMMMAVARLAAERGVECEVSLENTMACGIGACLCCVEDLHEQGNVCVCTEGPVFNAKQLKW